MAFKDEYILSVKEFDSKYIEDRDDLANILLDEYLLDYSYVNNANMLKVFVRNEDDLTKLNKMINKYASREYADDIVGDTSESIKNIIYNKMENRRFSNRRSARSLSLRERMEARNERFSRPSRRPAASRRRELGESFENRFSRRIRTVEESNARPMRFSTRLSESRVADRLSVSRINERNERIARRARRINSINESLVARLKRERLERLNEAEDAKKCPTTFEGKKIEKMTKAEKRSAAAQVRKDIKEAQKLLKSRQKDGRSTKAIEAKIEKLQALLDCLTKKEEVKESLRSRFARNRRIFEAEENVEDDNTEGDDSTEEPAENDSEDEESTDTDNAEETTTEEEFDDVDVKAITLKVLNKNVDKLKDALIEAGVEEDDIEVVDNEDAEDDDEVGIKVDVNSFDSLKSYCDSIGINLEEELGGEVVSDDEESEEDDKSEEDSETPAEDGDDEEDDDNFTDAELEDIFNS